MSRSYKSNQCQQLYDSFMEIFSKEGNCYDSIAESLDEGYEHHKVNESGIAKMLILNVLKDATVDFYKDKIKVIEENKYINERM